MSFSGLLPHTVEVYRRTAGAAGLDRFGQAKSQNPRQHTTGGEALVGTYKCRAYQSSGGLKVNEHTVDQFEREFKMFTEVGPDIQEDDAVRVLGANGEVIHGLAKIKDATVVYAFGTAHHCEYTIMEQSGPGNVTV